MNLRDQLMRDEGLVRHAYQDSEGYWTIGVGRLIDERKGGGLSREECMMLLDNDIARVKEQLYHALPWAERLDEVRRAVLLNMTFNLGINGLLGFRRMLSHAEHGGYDDAAAEMLDSLWARQVGDRALRLAEQMKHGEWQ